VNSKGGFRFGQLDLSFPQRFVAPVGDVGSQQITTFAQLSPIAPGRDFFQTSSLPPSSRQIGHHTLPRATLASIRFDQRPIGVPFAVLFPITGANEHGPMLPFETRPPRRKVFTTSPVPNQTRNLAPWQNDLRQKTTAKNFEIADFLTLLSKLG
jgi:hypothetical protein